MRTAMDAAFLRAAADMARDGNFAETAAVLDAAR